MEATTTLPKAKTRCGPEFAAQAYLACTKGVADARQQQSAAAQLAVAKADKAALIAALQPFANHACSPVGECACNNCRARDLIRKATA